MEEGEIRIHSIRSVYPRNNTQVVKSIINKDHTYLNKTRMLDWLSRQQYNPAEATHLAEHAFNIVKNFENDKRVLGEVTDIAIKHDHVLTPIRLYINKDGWFEIHNIPMTYRKRSTRNTMVNWANSQLLLYLDEKRTDSTFESDEGPIPSLSERLISSSNHKVVLKSELVKKYPRAFGE